MSRFFSRVLAAATIGIIAIIACTFRIEPVVEINDASVQVGPIYVCYDAGDSQ